MAVVTTPRQPFAELGASRLQSLSSAKNRQNALTDILSSPSKGKLSVVDSKINLLSSPSKRPYTPSLFEDENEDSENIDPACSPSVKRTKNIDGLSTSKPAPLFNVNVNNAPVSLLKQTTTPNSFAFPSAPSSAPAGRPLKPKRVGVLSKKRSSLSPYKRVEPPSFGSNKHRSAGLPFSIDAALSGTLSKPVATVTSKPYDVPALDEAMPKGWFFDIHEDTPDEEAAIVMEHSTGTLDISSDDEAGPSNRKDDRGKENIPPPDANESASASPVDAAPTKPRRSIHVDAMVDEGEERAPLGALPAEDFYAHGLDKDSVEVISDSQAAADADTDAQASPQTPITADGEDFPNKENMNALLSPTRRISPNSGSIDTGLSGVKADFVIAEDPVDAQA